MNLDEIKKHLLNISQFEILEIIDNSKSHSGHKGVRDSSNSLTHIEIKICNHLNMKKIDIHRYIYQRLEKEIKSGLHSIEIKISNT